MTVSRLRAYGEKWLDWVKRGARKRRKHVIPMKHCNKLMISCDPDGEYSLNEALMSAHRALTTDTTGHVTREHRRQAETRTSQAATSSAIANAATAEVETSTEDTANVTSPDDDVWRDMAGNAITTDEARKRGVHAQCTLATVRNLRRNPAYSVERLAERCYGARYVKRY